MGRLSGKSICFFQEDYHYFKWFNNFVAYLDVQSTGFIKRQYLIKRKSNFTTDFWNVFQIYIVGNWGASYIYIFYLYFDALTITILSVFGFFREREKVSQICIHPRSSFLGALRIMWWQRGEQEPECEPQA